MRCHEQKGSGKALPCARSYPCTSRLGNARRGHGGSRSKHDPLLTSLAAFIDIDIDRSPWPISVNKMLELAEPLASAQSKRRADTVYHALKRAILLRERLPGETLLEQDLANEMNCSQGTVREALMRLQNDGLVTRRGYRGTVVSDTSADEAALLAAVRIRIETNAAERAACSGTRADFDELDAIVALMRDCEAAGDAYGLSELDQRFHAVILRAAALQALEPILTRCMLHIHRHTVGNPVARGLSRYENASGAHESFVKILHLRNADKSHAAMRDHIEGVIKQWSPAVWKIMPAA
jgi:DNA-binding GntR family transcriptional regulator